MCLYLLRSGFSAGLRRAKTTEAWAKWRLALPANLFACSQTSRQLPTPLAYQELYEGRGEAVRKLDHKYCHIAVRLCFCIRHVLAPILGESFSVGLRRAKTTEICAK